MRIIAASTLKTYYMKHPETETGLKIWTQKVKKKICSKPENTWNTFTHARPIGDGWVVFNINKNSRLIWRPYE
jgi:mRNA-degrading endonuclease HigB of HigAB toxin-antitoxin module